MSVNPAELGPPDGPPPLGATFDPATGTTTFAVWAPDAESVEVCLLTTDRRARIARQARIALPDRIHGVWSGRVDEAPPGTEYGFRVHGPWIPERGLRFNAAKLLADPYARAFTGELRLDDAVFGYDVIRGDDTVRDLRDSAPFVPRSVVVPAVPPYDGARPSVPWNETVVYELHVRGHTMRHPAVPDRLRGTYAGLAHPDVIGDLVDLGVTTVELQPVQQFCTETWLLGRGGTNYWGYNPLGSFAPHAGYAANGSHGEQVQEFRSMVRAMHAAGLEVLIDVVYNHTCEQGEFGPTLSYRGIHNTGYYRLYDGGRRYVDITGTSNTLDLRQPRVISMVLDSLRYWVQQLGVDGFRFDLAPVLARTGEPGGRDLDPDSRLLTAIGADPVLSKVKLIAEPWDLGPNGHLLGGFPPGWAEWNDRFRDELRDFWRGESQGVAALATRLAGSADLFTAGDRRPYASINYVSCHDGFTLRDLVSYRDKHNEANLEDGLDGSDDNRSDNYGVEGETDDSEINALRLRQAANLLTSTLLAIGTPMLLAGDERGRTQRGNNNAYCQDNEVSWIDWSALGPWNSLREHVKALLRLRREHAVFRRVGFPDADEVGWFHPEGHRIEDPAWHDPELRTVGMYFAGDSESDDFLLWLNASPRPVEAKLPGRPLASAYRLVLSTGDEPIGSDLSGDDTFTLPPRSTVLLRAIG